MKKINVGVLKKKGVSHARTQRFAAIDGDRVPSGAWLGAEAMLKEKNRSQQCRDDFAEKEIRRDQLLNNSRNFFGETIEILPKGLSTSKSLSPDTMMWAWLIVAVASTMLSLGSRQTAGIVFGLTILALVRRNG